MTIASLLWMWILSGQLLVAQADSPFTGALRVLSQPQAPACAYFLDQERGVQLPFSSLSQAATFTMTVQGAQAEDALVAAGMALAQGIPSLYLVRDRKQLPWFLREADQSYPRQVAILEGEPATALREKGQAARSGLQRRSQPLSVAPGTPESPGDVDTFLGCLMSGLTEEQYAEGNSHLRAIDQALGQHLGHHSNFCEGLRVTSIHHFGIPRVSLVRDLEAVRVAKNCVFYVYDRRPRPSGMWVELGAALAWGKPSTLLTPDLGALPPGLDKAPNLRIIVYADHNRLLDQLKDPAQGPQLLKGP